MSLQEVKESFNKQELNKAGFIDAMYRFHSVLAEYPAFLKNTGIAKIEILDDQLIFTSRTTHYHQGGLKFLCDIEDKRTTPLEAFNFGNYEAEDSEMLYKLIGKDDVIFDIGGNIGWYTNHIAALLDKGIIYAFEPIPDTFNKLQRNVALNNFKNIRLNNLPFSNKVQTLTFYYSPLMSGASSSQNITNNADAIKVECTTATIDDFMRDSKISQLDFIKCDVEGAELLVFQGGIETIRQHKPIVFSEMLRKWAARFNYHPNDIIALFVGAGYACFTVRDGHLALLETVTEDTTETNFFFLHKDKHAAQIKTFAV